MSRIAQVQADVSSCLESAIDAVHRRDLAAVIEWLGSALSIYEENPSAVHEPGAQIEDLLLYIHAVMSFDGLGNRMSHVCDLQARADALQVPLH